MTRPQATYPVRFTKDEIEALLSALEAFDTNPPIVPDLEVYYSAVDKLKKLDKWPLL